MGFSLKDLEEKYEIGLNELGIRIKELGVRNVLLQLPDGLKPFGVAICDFLLEKCGVDALRGNRQQAAGDSEDGVSIRIWLGSCFGACDLPDSDADLVIQFGHAEW